ncbi:MAG: hypothetical protein EU535_05955 [Promethearchaeota archaeon]|nr:MAG: hypothetical protein EU535_05955 [Candidatus Lokiarchaeota archaeon]
MAELTNFNSFLLDIYSYVKYFNLSFKKFVGNPNLYVHCIIYLILNHPDQKYKTFQDLFQLDISEFDDLLLDFKSNESLEEFQFKSSAKSNKKRYLIAEDPILHNFKEQIETYFQKFLMCWEFPEVNFDENFDFLYHFSYFILDNGIIKKGKDSEEMGKFFEKNRLCLLIFIRKYLWEFLEKLELESEFEPPFLLLDYAQKKEALSNIFLSPSPLPSNEKKNIENYLYKMHIREETNIEFLKNLIMKIGLKITESSEFRDRNEQEKRVFFKSHLQFLLKIFQNIDKKQYEEFKKEKGILQDSDHISLSNSLLSDELFEDIIRLKIGFGEKVDYEKRAFTIRFLLERIDHFVNLYQIDKIDISKVVDKIKEVYKLAISNFSKKVHYQFAKKIQKIDIEDVKLLLDPEILEFLKKSNNIKIEKKSIKKRMFPFMIIFPEKEILVETWDSILNYNQNEPLKLIEGADQLFYTKFGFEFLEKMVDFAILLLKNYGINWTIRYIDLFFNYLKWFIKRKKIIDELDDFKNRQTIINVLDFLKNVIKAVVYWEYRDRTDTIQFVKEAIELYEEIKDNDNKLVNNFKHRLDQLKMKIF